MSKEKKQERLDEKRRSQVKIATRQRVESNVKEKEKKKRKKEIN